MFSFFQVFSIDFYFRTPFRACGLCRFLPFSLFSRPCFSFSGHSFSTSARPTTEGRCAGLQCATPSIHSVIRPASCPSGPLARATRSAARAGLTSACKVLIESLGSIIQKKPAPTESSFRLRLPPTLRVSCLRNHKCTHSCKSFSYRTW